MFKVQSSKFKVASRARGEIFLAFALFVFFAVAFSGCQLTSPPDHGADKARGSDEIKVEEKTSATQFKADQPRADAAIERIFRKVEWRIDKYRDDRAFARGEPLDISRFDGNLMLNEGLNEMLALLAGSGGTAYNNANSRCGVGDSAAAEAATQTDLQAATNKLYKAQNATFPTTGSQQIVFKCDYGSTEANFLWTEFTADNGATAAKNLNRKVSNQGTKTSGQTWTLTLTITWS